jgi:hypothetical protein
MDRSDAANLAFKLAGIYVLVEAIKLIPAVAPSLSERLGELHTNWRDVGIIGGALAFSCLLLGLLAWLLLSRSRRMADRLVGAGKQATIDFAGELPVAQAVAFSVVGLMMLADGLPRLVWVVADAVIINDQVWTHLRSDAPNLVVLFLELSAGYWLFFMPRQAARWWLGWSDAGRGRPRQPGPDPRDPGSG